MDFSRIIFLGQSGNCREPMAAGILQDLIYPHELEIMARALVFNFPEPMNQKAEAVLISNGIDMSGYTTSPLTEEDITEDTLILTMDKSQQIKVFELFDSVSTEQVFVLTEYVGEELEIIDPYGGTLTAYGVCYESMRNSLQKLVSLLYKEE